MLAAITYVLLCWYPPQTWLFDSILFHISGIYTLVYLYLPDSTSSIVGTILAFTGNTVGENRQRADRVDDVLLPQFQMITGLFCGCYRIRVRECHASKQRIYRSFILLDKREEEASNFKVLWIAEQIQSNFRPTWKEVKQQHAPIKRLTACDWANQPEHRSLVMWTLHREG